MSKQTNHNQWSATLHELDKTTKNVISPNELGDGLVQLVEEAGKSYEHAVSYRDFKVGAAALYVASLADKLSIAHGTNYKAEKDCAYDLHAEQEVLKRLQVMGARACYAIAVVGDIQVDQHSGTSTHTLHPCGWCRDRIADSPLVSDQTVIVTAHPDFKDIEFGTRQQYFALHERGHYSLSRVSNRQELANGNRDLAF